MENYRDTPLARFATFWWGLGLLVIMGAAVLILRLLSGESQTDLDTAAMQIRVEKRAEVDKAQAANLEVGVVEEGRIVRLAPEMVFTAMTPTLLAKPRAIVAPEQVVPGISDGEAIRDQEIVQPATPADLGTDPGEPDPSQIQTGVDQSPQPNPGRSSDNQ